MSVKHLGRSALLQSFGLETKSLTLSQSNCRTAALKAFSPSFCFSTWSLTDFMRAGRSSAGNEKSAVDAVERLGLGIITGRPISESSSTAEMKPGLAHIIITIATSLQVDSARFRLPIAQDEVKEVSQVKQAK